MWSWILSLCVYNDLYGFYRSASIEKSCTSMSNKVAQRRIKISRARSRDCRSFSKRDLVREFNLISGMESQIQHKSVDSLPQSHRHHKPNGVRLGLQLPPNLVHIKGILVFLTSHRNFICQNGTECRKYFSFWTIVRRLMRQIIGSQI